ncbi:MAG: AAA family ATPase [Bacteroidales bacterium]|nr:AAA family ATPase [Bacteroidales bacterium]
MTNVQNPKSTVSQSDSPVSLFELLSQEKTTIDTLVEPLLPSCGLAALIGSSDSGKSCLLRQLSASVVSGKDFLAWKTNPKRRKVLYVSTEDDREAVSFLVQKQNKTKHGSWKTSNAKTFTFCFTTKTFCIKFTKT